MAESSEVIFTGYFKKQGGASKTMTSRKNWKRRYFVLESNLDFKYYESHNCKKLKGEGNLRSVSDRTYADEGKTVVFCTPDRHWSFQFENDSQKDFWSHASQYGRRGFKQTYVPPSAKSRFSLAVMGAGGTGKSSLVLQYVYNQFPENYDPTIQDDFNVDRNIDGKTVSLSITDTAGQIEFAELQETWIRESDGIIIVYSVTEESTLDSIDEIMVRVHDVKGPEHPVVIVGNKIDMVDFRKVSREVGEAKAAQFECEFFETSAKTFENVNEVFERAVRVVRLQQKEDEHVSEKRCIIL